MEDNGWNKIVDAIDIKFGLADHGRSKRPLADAPHLTEQVSFVVFNRDGEKYKLERSVGPAIIDRKAYGAKRIGSDVRYENTYDPEETTRRTRLFQEQGGEWVEINADALGL